MMIRFCVATIFVCCFIVLFFLFYFVYERVIYRISNIHVVDFEFNNPSNDVHFVSYGTGSWEAGVFRIREEAAKIPLFKTVFIYNESFPAPLMTNHFYEYREFYNKYPHDRGHHATKTFIILDRLLTIPENDILVYVDAGCILYSNTEALVELNKIINIANKHEMFVYQLRLEKEVNWCKEDVLQEFNCITRDCRRSKIILSGIMILKNTESVRTFIKTWDSYSFKEDGHYLNFNPSIKYKDTYEYKGHESDQCTFSLLIKSNFSSVKSPYVHQDVTWNCVVDYTKHCWVSVNRKNGNNTKFESKTRGVWG